MPQVYIGVRHKNDHLSVCHACGSQTLLAIDDPVVFFNRKAIFESYTGRAETDAMILEIYSSFSRVPIEVQHEESPPDGLSARLTQRHYWLKTHVSLLPPPWLELTTSDPRLSATRVRPPGTMVTLSP